jgi:hypothetical protein
MFAILTCRFNNETLFKNFAFRTKGGYECLYCSPLEISAKISYGTPIFVIEMNNSTNTIAGIGLIRNVLANDRYYKVHDDANYNRYIYIGKYYLSRDNIAEINPNVVDILEQMLFKGKTHSKRGVGLSLLPEKVLKLDMYKHFDIKKDIKDLFIVHFREKSVKNGIKDRIDK